MPSGSCNYICLSLSLSLLLILLLLLFYTCLLWIIHQMQAKSEVADFIPRKRSRNCNVTLNAWLENPEAVLSKFVFDLIFGNYTNKLSWFIKVYLVVSTKTYFCCNVFPINWHLPFIYQIVYLIKHSHIGTLQQFIGFMSFNSCYGMVTCFKI